MAEEKKKDEEASQQEPQQQSEQERLERTGSYITIFFEAPGSANLAGLQTKGVSLGQVALAARELQNIVDHEQWWGFYASRMKQVEEEAAKRMEEEAIRRALMHGGGIKPS